MELASGDDANVSNQTTARSPPSPFPKFNPLKGAQPSAPKITGDPITIDDTIASNRSTFNHPRHSTLHSSIPLAFKHPACAITKGQASDRRRRSDSETRRNATRLLSTLLSSPSIAVAASYDRFSGDGAHDCCTARPACSRLLTRRNRRALRKLTGARIDFRFGGERGPRPPSFPRARHRVP